MTDHYAEAQAFVNEALHELNPQPDEQRRSLYAAQVHATLALVDVLAAWRADLDTEAHPPLADRIRQAAQQSPKQFADGGLIGEGDSVLLPSNLCGLEGKGDA